MHLPSGDLYDSREEPSDNMKKLLKDKTHEFIPVTFEELEELKPMTREQRKGCMRNKPCPCGSGVKFKRCCWSKREVKES